MENFADLYTNYLLSSTGLTTATGFSRMTARAISPDKIPRLLTTEKFDSKYLWKVVKPMEQEICSSVEQVIVGLDDSIEEKCYTDESKLISRDYDHTLNRSVKEVCFLTVLLHTKTISLPSYPYQHLQRRHLFF